MIVEATQKHFVESVLISAERAFASSAALAVLGCPTFFGGREKHLNESSSCQRQTVEAPRYLADCSDSNLSVSSIFWLFSAPFHRSRRRERKILDKAFFLKHQPLFGVVL